MLKELKEKLSHKDKQTLERARKTFDDIKHKRTVLDNVEDPTISYHHHYTNADGAKRAIEQGSLRSIRGLSTFRPSGDRIKALDYEQGAGDIFLTNVIMGNQRAGVDTLIKIPTSGKKIVPVVADAGWYKDAAEHGILSDAVSKAKNMRSGEERLLPVHQRAVYTQSEENRKSLGGIMRTVRDDGTIYRGVGEKPRRYQRGVNLVESAEPSNLTKFQTSYGPDWYFDSYNYTPITRRSKAVIVPLKPSNKLNYEESMKAGLDGKLMGSSEVNTIQTFNYMPEYPSKKYIDRLGSWGGRRRR